MKTTQFFAEASISDLYASFADDVAPTSPAWERVCRRVAATPELQALLDTLPGPKRQPNLFLAALRFHGGPQDDEPGLTRWIADHWPALEQTILSRHTQTNEVGRCAVLAPVLASVPQPVALLEVGMSAGLCLFPDLYDYTWLSPGDPRPAPDGSIVCEVTGDRLPLAVPEVAWRGGIDQNPLDPADPDDARWLRSLVWPGETVREERLAACLSRVAGHDLVRIAGDATDALTDLVAQVPAGLTVVVQHSAVLAYLPEEQRRRHLALLDELGVHWVTNEGVRVVEPVRRRLPAGFEDDPRSSFVLALDGEPLARVGQHGAWLEWLGA